MALFLARQRFFFTCELFEQCLRVPVCLVARQSHVPSFEFFTLFASLFLDFQRSLFSRKLFEQHLRVLLFQKVFQVCFCEGSDCACLLRASASDEQVLAEGLNLTPFLDRLRTTKLSPRVLSAQNHQTLAESTLAESAPAPASDAGAGAADVHATDDGDNMLLLSICCFCKNK